MGFPFNILVEVPMATFAVWFLIGVMQVYRGRTRTMTEVSFLLGSFAWAGYALSDWLVFHTPGVPEYEATAWFLARVSVSFVTIAAFFLLLFTKLFLTRASRSDLVFTLPFAMALGMVWSGMVTGVTKTDPTSQPLPWNWTALFDPSLFIIWVLYVVIYAMVGIWYLTRTYKVVKESSQFLSRRVFGIMISFFLALTLGLSTNGITHTFQIPLMPLFSSLLLLPAALTLYVLVPITRERLSSVISRWKSRFYKVIGVYLIYENGTLIASRTVTGDEAVDEDIFSATLDAIQTFMRTSFPLLLGKWLRRIEHGDVKILLERGRHSYLAVIIKGEDSDTLWIKMKEAVQRFEGLNEMKLPRWSGITEDLTKVGETIDDFLAERALFT